MKLKISKMAAIALAGGLATLGAGAQPPAGSAAGQSASAGASGGRAAAPAVKANIDLATARKMLAAAEAAAADAKANVAIAVVDANGDLVSFVRMDGATGRAVTSAQGKARTALLFGVPSKEAGDAVASGKSISVTLTNPVAGAELTLQQGGIPVFKDGKIVAAIGAGGSAPATDEKIAQAGADAAK
jgi:glc operon protein GlcG